MRLLFALLLNLFFSNTTSAVVCRSLFENSELTATIRALAELRLELDLAQTNNNDTITISLLKIKYKEKEKEVLRYVTQHQLMDRKGLIEKIKLEIADIQKQRQIRNSEINVQREAQDINNFVKGARAVFNRVEPGKFLMGPPHEQVETEIKSAFEMMSTTVTQVMWKEIDRLAKKYKFESPYHLPISEPSDLRPMHGFSWNDLSTLIRSINAMSQAGVPGLEKILLGHKQGDQYDLPTEPEWEFVARARGEFKGLYPYDDINLISNYAWFGQKTTEAQEVALKSPIVVDGKEFYDMLGNIAEWTKDLSESKFNAVVRGHRISTHTAASFFYGRSYHPVTTLSYIGFRLVRRIK